MPLLTLPSCAPHPIPADYMDRLAEDLCEYYGYIRELADMFLQMFSPSECVEFMEASDQSRPLVIRTNTLKTRRKDLAQVLHHRPPFPRAHSCTVPCSHAPLTRALPFSRR